MNAHGRALRERQNEIKGLEMQRNLKIEQNIQVERTSDGVT